MFSLNDSSGQTVYNSIQHKIKNKISILVRVRQENLVRSFFSPCVRLVENLFSRIKTVQKKRATLGDKQEYIPVYRTYFY